MQVKDPIIFTIGAGIGAAAAWYFTKRYYKKLADDEIASVKDAFAKLREDAQKRAEAAKNKPDLSKYVEALNKIEEREVKNNPEQEVNTHAVNYTDFTEEDEENDIPVREKLMPQPIEKNVDRTKPYLLNRMPYSDEDPDYTQIEVRYYADGTYADSQGREMEIEDYIGANLMGYVEETDKDEIFIRNEELGVDIDIVKDVRTYDDIMFG